MPVFVCLSSPKWLSTPLIDDTWLSHQYKMFPSLATLSESPGFLTAALPTTSSHVFKYFDICNVTSGLSTFLTLSGTISEKRCFTVEEMLYKDYKIDTLTNDSKYLISLITIQAKVLFALQHSTQMLLNLMACMSLLDSVPCVSIYQSSILMVICYSERPRFCNRLLDLSVQISVQITTLFDIILPTNHISVMPIPALLITAVSQSQHLCAQNHQHGCCNPC